MRGKRERAARLTATAAGHYRRARKTFAVRYLALFGGEAFSKACTMVAFAFLARVLGPKDFGLIELSLSVILFFVLGVESGLGAYGARMVAGDHSAVGRLVPRVVLLRAFFIIPAYLVILGVSASYGMPGVGVLAVYGLTVLLVPLFHQWVFQGLGHMEWVAASTSFRNLTFAGLVFFWIRQGSDPRMVAVAEVIGALVLVLFNAILLHGVLRIRLEWRGSLRGAAALFKETWSLGASNLTLACLWHAPTVLLGRLSQDPYLVAWLAASLRIVLALNTFVGIYFYNVLPNLTRELADGLEAWRAMIRRSLKSSMWLAYLFALAIVLAAPILVTTVYGSRYRASALTLQILIWMIPIGWFGGNFRYSLIAAGHQRFEFLVSAVTAVVTVVGATAFIPAFGATGAAMALVGGGITNAVLALIVATRLIGPCPVGRLLWLPAGTCLGCLALGLLVSVPLGHAAGLMVGCGTFLMIAFKQNNALVNILRLRQPGLLTGNR